MFTEQREAAVVQVVNDTATGMINEQTHLDTQLATAHDDITQVSCECKIFYH